MVRAGRADVWLPADWEGRETMVGAWLEASGAVDLPSVTTREVAAGALGRPASQRELVIVGQVMSRLEWSRLEWSRCTRHDGRRAWRPAW